MASRSTIVTVAEKAGVSTSTVSQVIRGSGRISAKTREKVLEAAREVNYLRDHNAAAMRSRQFKEIGLLIHRIANPFNAEVIAGVSNRLESQGYLVFVLDTQDDPTRQSRVVETLVGVARGGLLWVPSADTGDDLVKLLVAHRLPTVTFLRQIPGGHFDHVGIESRAGTREATEHLVKLGHTHIAFLGGEGDGDVRQDRIAGYKSVMEVNQSSAPIVWPCKETKESGALALTELLNVHPETTGIVCNGDMVAMGATLGLARLGKTAGKEVSVIGFDGTEEAALWTPALSTMTVDAFGLGEQLAQTLLDRIARPESSIKTINLAAKLVERETTEKVIAHALSDASCTKRQ